MARKVLIVEDESNIAELINLYLEKEGYETMVAQDGGKGAGAIRALPARSGPAGHHASRDGRLGGAAQKFGRADKTPVIMLTAKGETIDKVAGPGNGRG